jgi:response regulator RpfG family c-di-GMP phosphodiesterase
MKAVKILVVDDKAINLNSAKEQFQNKNVETTYCPLFSVAVDLLKRNQYDVVLTDLMLPGESNGISQTNPEIGVEVPYGLVLAIFAKKIGISHVAILTDISHHSGPIAWAMDILLGKSEFISCFSNKRWLEAAEKFVAITNSTNSIQKEASKKSLILAGSNDSYKEFLKEVLGTTFDVTIVKESSTSELFSIYTEKIPDHILLIGEINEEAKDADSYVKKIFDNLKIIKSSEQKIIVAGFMDSHDSCYKRLPFTASDLAAMLNE